MPDRRKRKEPKPKYTADRNIPGAFEGETVTRRRFMVGTVNGAGAVAAGAFTLPALGFALGPVFQGHSPHWEDVGSVHDFSTDAQALASTNDTYVPKIITTTPGIGEAGKTTVYMRKRNPAIDTEPADRYNQYIAVSTRCMHVGCPVRFTAASQSFVCPCHGGVYNFRGIRTGGPPVRPLDRFYTRVVGDRVQVGPRYSNNSELHRFSPRDPGEPLDGIGQYLYPSRPTARKL
jgi:Rieske Fe-S protein